MQEGEDIEKGEDEDDVKIKIVGEEEYKLEKEEKELADAQSTLRALKKVYLLELSAFRSPAYQIKKTIGLIGALFGVGDDWESCRELIKDLNLLDQLLNLKIEEITPTILTYLEVELADAKMSFEEVDRVSLACTTLVKWLNAVVNYLKWRRRFALAAATQ